MRIEGDEDDEELWMTGLMMIIDEYYEHIQ